MASGLCGTKLRPRTITRPPHGWSVAEPELSPGLQLGLTVACPALPSTALWEKWKWDTFRILSLALTFSLGFSLLCFSEDLRGWPELVGEEVFPRNGSMLCVRAVQADRADLYCVCSGFPFLIGSPGRSCFVERKVKEPWSPRWPDWGWVWWR